MKWVKMEHPKLKDQPIVVAESAIPIHKRSGWKLAKGDDSGQQEKVSNDGSNATDK